MARYVDDLAALDVSHVTLTVNAVDPEIGAKIYAWVRDSKHVYRGRAGAELLWGRQAEAIRGLKRHGVTVKINTIIIPGVNDEHVPEVARRVAELGADIANCVPLYPVEGTEFGSLEPPSHDRVAAIRAEVRRHLPIMEHCTRCRADAVGLLGEPMPPRVELALLHAAAAARASRRRPALRGRGDAGRGAGQSAPRRGRATGDFPAGATAASGWSRHGPRRPPAAAATAGWPWPKTLHDCRALLVASAGESPCSVLAEQGIKVIFMEGLIEEGLEAVYRGVEIRSPMRKEHRCGSGCAGDGQGCS